MSKSYQKEYRDNITDEQEQKRREAIRQYQKKYRDNMTDEQKKYRDNMSDKQKQKQRDYQIDYRKKYYAAKKLNKIINDNDNKIIDDDDNKIIDDNDFYCISIIIKLKNIVPIKDINSILKINKKVCSQAYLEECDFINDGYNKNG